jgi:hypothetical protein
LNNNTVSFWNQTGQKTHYPRLSESISTDVLIIGSGITGVTTAYCLAQKGLKPALIEAGGLCDGTTGNTTGKVTVQHGVIYYKIKKKYGPEAARDYAASQKSALEFVKNTVDKESIDCQLAENTAYIYAVNDNEWDKKFTVSPGEYGSSGLSGPVCVPPGPVYKRACRRGCAHGRGHLLRHKSREAGGRRYQNRPLRE